MQNIKLKQAFAYWATVKSERSMYHEKICSEPATGTERWPELLPILMVADLQWRTEGRNDINREFFSRMVAEACAPGVVVWTVPACYRFPGNVVDIPAVRATHARAILEGMGLPIDPLLIDWFDATAPAQTAVPASPTEPDFALLANRAQLIEVFGAFTGMDFNWFKRMGDTPALLAARKVTGRGGRSHIAEPMFCPFEVLKWLIDPARRKGRKLGQDKGWQLFEKHFPRAYAAYSVGDPRPN